MVNFPPYLIGVSAVYIAKLETGKLHVTCYIMLYPN